MTVNGYLICNALIIFVPLIVVTIYNKALKRRKIDYRLSYTPILLIISIALIVAQLITKEKMFGAFVSLADLFMAIGIILKTSKIINDSDSAEAKMGYVLGGIITMLIPVVLTGISIFIL